MVTWTDPAALWLLAAVPLVWAALAASRTSFNTRQRRLQAAVRSAMLAALAAALAGPVVSRTSSRQSIVYAVDVSHSVSAAAIESAAARIDALNASLRPAHTRVLAFGEGAAALAGTDGLRQLARMEQEGAAVIDRRGTNIEGAIAAARAELAPGHVPRIVLFSDGRATAGRAESALTGLAAARIPLSVEPLLPRSLGDTWIDRLDVPDRLPAGASFTAVVEVESQRGGEAVVELRAGGKLLATRTAALPRGRIAVPLDAVLEAPGDYVLRAHVRIAGDPLAANDALERGMWADAPTKVLYVEGTPARAGYLSRALTASGFEVTVRPPAGLPASAPALDPFDAVVLSDVPRAAMPPASMSALAHWVERGGGGLLIAGGESVFGEGGYRDTPIERLAPVTFERRDEPEVALVLVLDRSWSMAGTSMDLCKAAAQAAVDVMTDEQALGVLTFNDQFAWDIPVRTVGGSRDEIRRKIAAIEPGGHTLIFPAVEQAYLALRNAKARARHVLLLSDGRSYPDDYEGLVTRMAASRITVSTIAVGPSADPELLRNIAAWGRGRAYQVLDARELPQIFVKEAKNAATPGFDEKAITPVVKAPAFLGGLDLARMPPLRGANATVLKDTALELVATDGGDPLLAFWPIGLGRTAVFASDVKDRWAAEWVAWRGYGPFFSAAVRAIERRRPPAAALEVAAGAIRRGGRPVDVSLEARDPEGRHRDLLHPAVRVRAGSGAARELPLRQVAPGRYTARVLADAALPLTVSLDGPERAPAGTSLVVLPDPAAEYRFRAPDEGALRALAAATGGAWKPGPEALAAAGADRRAERRPVWPLLLGIALGLWFVDILVRRVRVFEPRAGL